MPNCLNMPVGSLKTFYETVGWISSIIKILSRIEVCKMSKKLGDVGTHFVLENEYVKVWDLILEPGRSSSWHHHTMNYLFVVTEPGRLRVEFDDGTGDEEDYELGRVVVGQKDSVHQVTNSGANRYRNTIVELKQQEFPASPL